jgi:hypothetical protein
MIDFPLPDLDRWPLMKFESFKWLIARGVPGVTAAGMAVAARVITGVKADDGILDEDPDGEQWLAFCEVDDVVFWQPNTGELATWNGRAFALGEEAIYDASTYAFDCHLKIYLEPLDWLRCRCDGIVVLDWTRAFDRLRDCPRIAVEESLLPLYRRHMRPCRMPDLFVIPAGKRAAA